MAPSILLLKTRSSPNDGYDDYFSANNYTPTFVPVLEHRFHTSNLAEVRELFASGAFNPEAENTKSTQINTYEHTVVPSKHYGGMIFTSQRAVEGFAHMIEEHGLPSIPSIPLYTVGPATARTLTTLRDKYLPTSTIHGADTGTGENLAYMMLDHYNDLQKTGTSATSSTSSHPPPKPGLLFLVGEQRRDIIPKTLMNPMLPESKRIDVQEIVVYETGEMDSFETDFKTHVQGYNGEEGMWVVVFSPSGCEAMLRVLQLGPFAATATANATAAEDGSKRKVFVATIGPTTRDHLRNKFGFEPDVCAEKPNPEGVAEGIRRFMAGLNN
ncbi:Tetrapyrrole biosynthesis uroporphyrinogen III synthase [Penicillium cosmopolitanum]|uniref:Tetrapyrrole biosynthesis uroporphyrinogen III synthase n=1 Tax=Penicillium cosmopolitanum TaxID=1131564 RepID=A0A9W9VXH9_9EURO|nr:Tetrapyrrole biosynthesis uroporphyrinogen III synthase [Penicillium cosmopolitanum]KAJ5391258.1 Tetrapyrrole biosynthesis uroporphyrinogen III synthase [Penicillium cosmopolitanum]